MGLVDPDDRILRLCPLPNARLMVHYHFPAAKGLGRWVGSRDLRSVADAPLGTAQELIAKFYKGRHDEFLFRLASLSG